ncbi:MAG: hypothetical protein JSR82_03165 [Verrucomicrobia bacterium]|nr:hypothetical protein [Verrucomicrobiota bacterium]
MTALLFVLNAAAFAAGQLLLKLAMSPHLLAPKRWPNWCYFAGGIAGLAVSFFLSLGLLQRLELSYFFPLQGANVFAVILGSMIFLRERPSRPLLVGALLVAIGIGLVSVSS